MLSKFNINIGPILASAGIVGLAVGFGAQELVRDFIIGILYPIGGSNPDRRRGDHQRYDRNRRENRDANDDLTGRFGGRSHFSKR